MASRPAPADSCPASGRQLGHVRKSLGKKMWSARFNFGQHAVKTTLDAPMRATKADAELDRKFVATAMSRVPRASRANAGKNALKALRVGAATNLLEVPGSASTCPLPGLGKVSSCTPASKLRSLASCTPGIVRNKKNAKGKWVPKTCKELRAELLALKAAKSTQALPGRQGTQKRQLAPS